MANHRIEIIDEFYTFLESAFLDDSRFVILRGGAGSGKSHSVARFLIVDSLRQKQDVLIMRTSGPALTRSCWKLILSILDSASIPYSMNKTEKEIKLLHSGSLLSFVSMDDKEKLKSIEGYSKVWVEEATQFTKEELDQLNIRIRVPKVKNKIVFTFNPVSIFHHIKTELIDKRTDWVEMVSNYKINMYNPEEYVRQLETMRTINPSWWRIYGLGEWGTLEGIIYTNWETYELIENFDEQIYGLDFGFNNPTALIDMKLKDKEPYIEQKIYESGLTNPDLISKMNQIGINKNAPLYCDNAEPARIMELKRAGYNAKTADKSVKDGIDRLQAVKIHIHKSSNDIQKEISGYCWESKNEQYKDEPVKFNDHSMDAIRYAYYTHTKRGVINFSTSSGSSIYKT